MIALAAQGVARGVARDITGRISFSAVSEPQRADVIRALGPSGTAESLTGYLAAICPASAYSNAGDVPIVLQCPTGHLEDGDVVSINPRGYVRTVYRRHSRSNSLFATDRCNSFCLMCSQPPRDIDDSRRAAELMRIVNLIHPDTEELGITGGEPTLLGQGLLDVVASCRDVLPRTALHILSNGRRFRSRPYAEALGAIAHPDLMVGIPVYSDIDDHHDYVVQAKGSFAETVNGLHNLALAQVAVEIRIVIHQETYKRLPQLAQFIYRNLTFATHVAFMGLEIIGFAQANIRSLWIDPVDYAQELEDAVSTLAIAGMNVSIYNHQLCALPRSLWPFTRRSISDWKNEFAAECSCCTAKPECGGFFTWNLKQYRSRAIAPIAC